EQFESFLYFIGSVFAPMIAIQVVDSLIFQQDASDQSVEKKNLLLWLIGFLLYRYFMTINTPIGNTLPVMLIVTGLYLIIRQFKGGK
ncbi:MAG: putative hydroxymethylpyrimidine transporter CytX, partial [Negativicutes bacterium]|nr:putative hydroxymethylpyrimidine transporter CytX [Negativicutes bacterium]